MPPPPLSPKVYHITHVDNLPSILAAEHLVCDADMLQAGGPAAVVGMSEIKQRRLTLPVNCYPGDHVGDYVPFYFCPRSIMLYLLYKGNHPGLTYRGGQEPLVHLEADLHSVVRWAEGIGRRWAFSLSNAGAYYTQFRNSLDALQEINWPAVAATDFRSPDVKEGKQAEFLVRESSPWHLVERVGVNSMSIARRVYGAIVDARHRPMIEIKSDWYF